jgi:hypothetical protein
MFHLIVQQVLDLSNQPVKHKHQLLLLILGLEILLLFQQHLLPQNLPHQANLNNRQQKVLSNKKLNVKQEFSFLKVKKEMRTR